jgi:HK97 gp10 family phage protein
MDGVTFKMEGLDTTLANLEDLSKATRRNALRRALLPAAEPIADTASRLAPVERGVLAFSVVVSTKLTQRHKKEQKDRESEVEVYVGPSAGQGALFYASHVEFGTITNPAQPYLRPAWEGGKTKALNMIVRGLKTEVDKAADRAARKAARLAKV